MPCGIIVTPPLKVLWSLGDCVSTMRRWTSSWMEQRRNSKWLLKSPGAQFGLFQSRAQELLRESDVSRATLQ